MKKEIIIRLSVKTEKCQAKAMKVAAAVSGVESVTLAGGDKSLLLVIGDGVDSNKLIKKLKKKAGEAEIVELRTVDSFEAALPLPLGAGGRGSKEMAAVARSPYHYSNNNNQLRQYSYTAAPSPYAYHYYPSPVGGYGYGYGDGVSSYSLAVARNHPANYSPLVERHDYQPMDDRRSSDFSSKKKTLAAVPRRESDTNRCTIL
ncbi:hypothetical protein EJB05_21080 [Eragrostis curvula]|uniref:HMA domain-containing protein n=1 Tax=Eragrostis curvula TaxID=38414 RepID=A0A5J9V2E7_9POAL|nr:hypothetical protein EJB05_21080 [Eragrostis curvula]